MATSQALRVEVKVGVTNKKKLNGRLSAPLIYLVSLFAFGPVFASETVPAPALNAPVAAPGTSASDKTLISLIHNALALNPTIAGARAASAQAIAAQSAALGRTKLQISYNAQISGSNGDVIQLPPAHETFGTLQNTVTIPLPTHKDSAIFQQSRSNVLYARAEFESARKALATQVIDAYLEVIRARSLSANARTATLQAEQQLAAATKRERAGDVPMLDVLRAQVPLATAQAAEFQSQNAVIAAEQILKLLTGQTDISNIGSITTGQTVNNVKLSEPTEEAAALATSPELKAAQFDLKSKGLALKETRFINEPQYSVQISDIRTNDQTGFSRLDTILGSVTIPLKDGGTAKALQEQASASVQQAEAAVNAVTASLVSQVQTQVLTISNAQSQLEAATVARDIAQTTYDKTQLGYEDKLYSLADVLNSQVSLRLALDDYVQAVFDLRTSELNLNLLDGTWTPWNDNK